MTNLLIIDANNLAHRTFHSLPDLSHAGESTGVIYGFLRVLLSLQNELGSRQTAIAFDYGSSLRQQSYPSYKLSRRQKKALASQEDKDARRDLHRQIRRLRDEILPAIGFQNILYADGYEADDVIASVCKSLSLEQLAVVVSTDHDLYQLLDVNISICKPKKGIGNVLVTPSTFHEEYGISAKNWSWVKAAAGCTSDDIQGLKGIGEITAIKFLLRTLKPTSKAYQTLDSAAGKELILNNLKLTTLPLEGCPRFSLKQDKISADSWRAAVEPLGMVSLLRYLPFISVRKVK